MTKNIAASGPKRWRRYGSRVFKLGLRPVWSLVSVVFGVGAVAILHFAVSVSAWWVVSVALGAYAAVATIGGYRSWSAAEQEPTVGLPKPEPPAPSLIELLYDQLRLGYRLDTADLTDNLPEDFEDDAIYQWGLQTWRLLERWDPRVAKDFFGDDTLYGSEWFGWAFATATDGNRFRYLQDRLNIVERALPGATASNPVSLPARIHRTL